MRAIRNLLLAAAGTLALAACTSGPSHLELARSEAPEHELRTGALNELQSLPPPLHRIAVAVYGFNDMTGQNKPNESFPEYSRAVTQGGTSILINALERAGDRSWFTPVERSSLQALLQERQIIRVTRQEYGGDDLPPLPPLTYAGIMLDGGIIGYDSNTLTGGFGARFLGIGASTQYRRDTVTVYLRAVSVQTGEVLKSVNISKTIYSIGVDGGVFKYVDYKKLLEIETGLTTNEPVTLAVKTAVEKAVHTLIMEGLIDGYWTLQDRSLVEPLVSRYTQERDGVYGVETIHAYQNGVRLEPPTSQSPVIRNGSPEAELAPKVEPGVPEVSSGPTYVLPSGQNPIPSGDRRRMPPGK